MTRRRTRVIIELLGGVALLLWGVRMVRTGIMRAWGDRLKRFIETASHQPHLGLRRGRRWRPRSSAAPPRWRSSSPDSRPAAPSAPRSGLAVLLGADVGSAVVSAVFASGSVLRSCGCRRSSCSSAMSSSAASREFRPHNVGRILIGFGARCCCRSS